MLMIDKVIGQIQLLDKDTRDECIVVINLKLIVSLFQHKDCILLSISYIRVFFFFSL